MPYVGSRHGDKGITEWMIPVQVGDCWECPDNHLVLTLIIVVLTRSDSHIILGGYNVLLEAAYNL